MEAEHLTPNQRAWRRFRRNHPAVASLAFLLLFLGAIMVWPVFSKTLPNTLSDAQFERPSSQHWCGTDIHGRDVLERIIYGARISLLVGAVGALVSLIIGVSWGAVAGYIGGRLGGLVIRGLGIQPPMASWGSLIAEGAGQLNAIRIYWWLLVFPCAALVSTLLALNFFGDGLRDACDPRSQN